ncbi:hypothetical protein JAAARDRAFT_684619 [Jaapia argillacea MUCL 33604]|uniref:TOG domain-containing protein n=1 Tax=Jaapia argillacea MUCL 33604 TaxID=933084 RepID=A0A067QMP0_9AGAM|nr:hypothetical protein JAAARDRAFT_684619 [Jaapia argillacea MUCL 33604]
MDETNVEKLVNQAKSNDVDAKIDAISKLQAEFESGVEITDTDSLIGTLKACLRISNQHLQTATLSALPPFLPLVVSRNVLSASRSSTQSPTASTSSTTSSAIDVSTLRHALVAFLPSPGVIDRLGDSRDKPRDKARETLVILGGLAFRSGGSSAAAKARDNKGPETPLAIFERYLKESGLGSKVWRVREQSILTLVHIRRTHHLFPIRPYLTLLVQALEDMDGNVRECARQSIVELFTGPAVSDGARADLKKELTKKNVRKTIVDALLSQILAGGQSSGGAGASGSEMGSENGDAGVNGYLPPSLALLNRSRSGPVAVGRTVSQTSVGGSLSRPASRAGITPPTPVTPTSETAAEVKPVYIASIRDLENEFARMQKPFEGKESEHNWGARDQAITLVRGMLKGDVHNRYNETFLACLKSGFIDWSLKTLASLRTTVASNTCSLYAELVAALGTSLDPVCDTLYVNLFRMTSLTKKIIAQQSQDVVTSLITHTSAQPRLVIPLLWTTLQDKNVQARVYVVGHLKTYMEVHGARSKHAIESTGGHEILEKCVKKGLADPNPGVKEGARLAFWVFDSVWHEKGRAIMASLDTTSRRNLEKLCPDPNAVVPLPPTTPSAKKTSVAAAIAATRAKAKAVATAPPTLRHQATSSAHAARTTSPPSNRVFSPTGVTPPRPSSPLSGLSRSMSPPTSPGSRSRIASSGSGTPPSPSRSSPTDPFTARKRIPSTFGAPTPAHVSPTGRGYATLRKAMETALPASPESTTAYVNRASPTPVARQNVANRGSPTPAPRVAVKAHVSEEVHSLLSRRSLLLPKMNSGSDDESLLLATQIPVPDDDSEDDMGDSVNLISFSTPYELYPPPSAPRSFTDSARSPTSPDTNVLSTYSMSSPPGGSEVVIEDAMRARAEQAESAAERLLELVEPDELSTSSIHSSLLMRPEPQMATPKAKARASVAAALRAGPPPLPVTPVNRNTMILRQAALFKDSPAYNPGSSSLLDVLKDRKHETGWWLKRMTIVEQGTPLRAVEPAERVRELQTYIARLEKGDGDIIAVFRKLALLCIENPLSDSIASMDGLPDPSTPSPFFGSSRSLPSLYSDMWDKDRNFDKLFRALITFLDPSKPQDELEYALIVLWEMLSNQAPYLEGQEAELFSVLLQVRYCNKLNVLEATNTIRDALTSRIEPVYGLTTLHACLRAFHAAPVHPSSTIEVKSGTYAYGLVAMGKFVLRLPAEVLEDELPRLKPTLISALNDTTSLVVRESAAAAIIAAQLVLRDESHLFSLLDGLADEKKNLLTYLFDKHGARGVGQPRGPLGMERLEKEMKRLDTRTSTPPRAPAA